MLASSGHKATAVGVVGKDLDGKAGREAAYTAALNALALTKKQLGSLDRVSRVVRLCVYVAATPEFTDHPKIADAASELLRDIFGEKAVSSRLVFGVATVERFLKFSNDQFSMGFFSCKCHAAKKSREANLDLRPDVGKNIGARAPIMLPNALAGQLSTPILPCCFAIHARLHRRQRQRCLPFLYPHTQCAHLPILDRKQPPNPCFARTACFACRRKGSDLAGGKLPDTTVGSTGVWFLRRHFHPQFHAHVFG